VRIYQNFTEMHSEVGRDLVELGTEVPSHSVQAFKVREDPNFDMKEIIGYAYRLDGWHDTADCLSSEEWCYTAREHAHRMSNSWLNPGEAWQSRMDLWEPMLNQDGEFDYTYNERIRVQLDRIYKELLRRPNTRQAVLTIYDKEDQRGFGGKFRVPCSLHYQFLVRKKRLHMIYSMRSCDYFAHFKVDVALAIEFLCYMADILGVAYGTFTHFIGSLHCFRKDWESAGIF